MWSNSVLLFRLLASGTLLAGCALALLSGCSGNSSPVNEQPTPEIPAWYTLSGMFPSVEGEQFKESLPSNRSEAADLIVRGGYLTESVAACGYCHMDATGATEHLSGGRLVRDETGSGLAPNITPDTETGIGAWTIDEIIQAFRAGVLPDGEKLSVEVHQGYRWMSNRDARAITAYLLSQKPVRSQIRNDEDRDFGLFSRREKIAGYVPSTPDTQATEGYGRYISQSLASCQRCHSPPGASDDPEEMLRGSKPLGNNSLLGSISGKFLGDTRSEAVGEIPKELLSEASQNILEQNEPEILDRGAFKESGSKRGSTQAVAEIVVPPGAPNIRGSEGLRQWGRGDIVTYLESGRTPEGRVVPSESCPWEYYQGMSEKDMQAVAAYLTSL